jgi:hypothetical protein
MDFWWNVSFLLLPLVVTYFHHNAGRILKRDGKNREWGYWNQSENRRQFLIDLAKSKGLDPFAAVTWYKITRKDIINAKVHTVYKCNICN